MRNRMIAITAAVLLSAGCAGASPGPGGTGTVSTDQLPASTSAAGTTSVASTPTETAPTETTPAETTPATTSTGQLSTGPTTTEPAVTRTAVYYVRDTGTDVQLVRELREIPQGPTAPAAAIGLMIAGPQDPAYATTWNPDTRVLGVTVTPQLITVDLSADARTANVGSGGAALMVQQLVWTATEAAGEPGATVLLTIAGAPAGELWGVLTWTEPIGRDESLTIGG